MVCLRSAIALEVVGLGGKVTDHSRRVAQLPFEVVNCNLVRWVA